MSQRLLNLLLAWIALLALLAIELGSALFLPLSRSMRPLILLPAALMIVIVARSFMELGRSPTIARLFAAGSVLWLLILLGLGSLDPITRVVYPAESTEAEAIR